jgi:hypothetical protein
MTNILMDTWINKDCTIGRLKFEGFQCLTLELPWLSNQVGISCIPAGIYEAVKYYSPSKGDVILFLEVENRTWIEIHAGNYTSQIEGCILVGDSLKYLNSDGILDVTSSKSTLDKMLSMLPEVMTIEVTRCTSTLEFNARGVANIS